MATQYLVKRPGDIRTYAVNFGFQPELRDSGESLTGTPTVSAAISVDTPTQGATLPVITAIGTLGPKVVFAVSGGTDQTDYVFNVTVTTSGSHTLQEFVTLQVRQNP